MIQLVSGRVGFLSFGTTLFESDSRSRVWAPLFQAPAEIRAIDFLDPHTGWIEAGAELEHTTDGGRTWTVKGVSRHLSNLRFVDPSIGYALGASISTGEPHVTMKTSLLATTNGGKTWRDLRGAGKVTSFCFVDAFHGYATTGSAILQTSDGGKTWAPGRILGVDRGWQAFIAFPARLACSGTTAWALFAEAGGMNQQSYLGLRTTDLGATWKPVLQHLPGGDVPGLGRLPLIDAYTGPIAAASPSVAYFLGSCAPCGSGEVSVTRTGTAGSSWSRGKLIRDVGCCGLVPVSASFADPSHGWVIVEQQRANPRPSRWFLMATSDGRTWTRLSFPRA
jgi:photosystem II stability/assembly factor-like uncharacterized protein